MPKHKFLLCDTLCSLRLCGEFHFVLANALRAALSKSSLLVTAFPYTRMIVPLQAYIGRLRIFCVSVVNMPLHHGPILPVLFPAVKAHQPRLQDRKDHFFYPTNARSRLKCALIDKVILWSHFVCAGSDHT